MKINIIPRDKYGNHLGPGRLGALSITGTTGTTPTEQPQDNRDGSYSVTAIWDPSLSPSPGIVISQTGRPPVIVVEPGKGQILPEPGEDQKLRIWLWVLLILVVILLLIIIALLLSRTIE